MIQEILTYIIIFSAVFYAVYSFYKVLITSKKTGEHSCSGGCAGCSFSNKINADIKVVRFN